MHKTFKLEIKGYGEPGSFTGMASVYGNKDLGGDVVEPGAFAKTLSDKGGMVPILWQHDPTEPIGMGTLTDTADGLQISGDLAIDSSPVAQKAYGLLKRGILKGLSIGYDAVRKEMKNGTRHLQELKLWEVSIVTFPMNEMASVTGIKAAEEAQLTLAEFIEDEKLKFKALFEQYAAALKAPADQIAATLHEDAPEILHPSLDRISQLLRS
jgi:HK97 family phage prohead protease